MLFLIIYYLTRLQALQSKKLPNNKDLVDRTNNLNRLRGGIVISLKSS